MANPALVQNTQNTSLASVASLAATYSANVTAGNCLVAVCGSAGTAAASTVSDSLNGTWPASSVQGSNSGTFLQLVALPNSLGGACTVTMTFSSGNHSAFLAIMEWSGVSTSVPVDQTFGNAGLVQASSFSIGPTGNTQAPNEIVICAGQLNASEAWTAGAGFTLISPATGYQGVEYFLTASSGPQTGAISWAANAAWSGVVATLLPALAGQDTLLGQGWV